LCFVGLLTQSLLVVVSLRGIENRSRIGRAAGQDVADHGDIIDPTTFRELGVEHGPAERLAPGIVEPHQRDPRRQQARLRERLRLPERERQVGA
jgi:hypothetical protein